MSTGRGVTPLGKRTMGTPSIALSTPDVLGDEQVDLARLKKQAHLTRTELPKTPRITRTLRTLDSVLKVLEDHGRTSKLEIDHLVESVAQENHQFTRQLHEAQMAYLKLQAHTASLQSLKECYCRYAHMLDGARTMFNAYQQSTARRDSIDKVKLGLKECTQTLCAIEAQLEAMLGTFVLHLQEISGFSRICPGDEYEVVLRYGTQQKWKTRGRILKQDKSEQIWSRQICELKVKLVELLLIKVSEVKLLGVSLRTVGTKCFEINNLFAIQPQRMVVNANQSGTIKLLFLINWDLYHQVDTKFTFYNPNRTYSDVTRTWSMFVGNTTLLRTVNDTLSSTTSSQFMSKRLSTFCPLNETHPRKNQDEYVPIIENNTDYDEIDAPRKNEEESIPREEIFDSLLVHDDTGSYSSSSFVAGFNSDDISSVDDCHNDEEEEDSSSIHNHSIYELDLLIDQVRTCLDDLRLIDRSFSTTIFDQLERSLNELDTIIKSQVHEQTERTLEIEDALIDFDFLNTFDDEETSKTIDSGFEGERKSSPTTITTPGDVSTSTINESMHTLLVDILNIILILLHYIQNRSNSDDHLVLSRLDDQLQQLDMASIWCKNHVQNIQQALTQADESIVEFWSRCCSDEFFHQTFVISTERCQNELAKYLNCNSDVAEYLLNNVCCAPFRTNFLRPKSVTLMQIWFLLRKDRSQIDQDIQLATEQLHLSNILPDLITNNQYQQMATMLNRRTLNNDQLLTRFAQQYNFKIPDELIRMLSSSIRLDLISYLRAALLSHGDQPSMRLQIHKTILNVQQVDSL